MNLHKNFTHIKKRVKAIKYTHQLSKRVVVFIGKELNRELKINLNNYKHVITLIDHPQSQEMFENVNYYKKTQKHQ